MLVMGLPPCTNLAYAQDDTSQQIAGQASSTSGLLSIVWGDSKDGKSNIIYNLTDASGHRTLLQLDETVSRKLGGVLQFNGKHVTAQGTWAKPSYRGTVTGLTQSPSGVLNVDSISLAPSPTAQTPTINSAAALATGVSGAKPWVTIMCKFSDIATEPHDRAYFLGMYGNTKPGLNHYWKELSFNNLDLTGSTVAGTGWYTLPNTESHYNPTGKPERADKDAVMIDCITAADADVDFSLYSGINMMFNSDYDKGWAWGGGTGLITLDGVTREWGRTLEPPWAYADISVIAHEMGHGIGLPHSTAIDWTWAYDNAWDVMSEDRFNCAAATDPTYGCMAQHTISYHKDLLGWIPGSRKIDVAPGTSRTVILEDLAAPASSNYQLVKIPIGGSATNFYTVEARRLTGYDVKLPGAAVIIHNVDTASGAVLAPVGLSATDTGVMWTVGETFTDATNNISATVNSATATGFEVTISNNNGNLIKSKTNSSLCMGVKHKVSEGANVQLYNCSDADVNKNWKIASTARTVCQTGDGGVVYCIDFRANAVDAIVTREAALKDNQKWLYAPVDKKFHGHDPSLCLDVDSQSPNSQVKVTKCESWKQFQTWDIQ